ncbi:MAB_1171c family putative transporter [Phytoactinopolyspora limicola]|uniref:MAB_1171c family putative transporter n=1 Tax=Phytoactinopolyspora limicola TaxID=2715536 RepID=UPI0014075ED8|nr:MAB_1171c family putative transporter [Phytoactinopolyspora limicola]
MSTYTVIPAILLWVAVAFRLPTRRKNTSQRHLLVGLTALAIACTLEIPSVSATLQERIVSANTPHLVKHIAVVVAASAIWEVARHVALTQTEAATHRARRAAITISAICAMIGMFLLAPEHDEPLPGLTNAAVGEPALLAYWTAYLAVLAVVVVGIARVAVSALRTFPAGALRTGVLWMGAGALVALAYCLNKAVYLVTATAGLASDHADLMESVQARLLALTVFGFVVGSLWPIAVRWPLIRHIIAYMTYRRLLPVWRAYLQGEPGLAFSVTGRARLYDVELRLYRRVIEIRDGMLAARAYADPGHCDLALREARRVTTRDPDLIGEAAWLETGRRAKLRRVQPSGVPQVGISGGATITDEIRVLTRIAKSWPLIQTIADRIDDMSDVRKTST